MTINNINNSQKDHFIFDTIVICLYNEDKEGDIMELREYRNKCGMTQKEAALFLGVSDKTYFRYENDDKYINTLKYRKMCDLLSEKCRIDEEHGLLSISGIKEIVGNILSKYDINYCYLFGSYAKGKATETSDVDLFIDSDITGLKYFGLLQELMDSLHKKVDLIKVEQAKDNISFINEILKEGIKIYG